MHAGCRRTILFPAHARKLTAEGAPDNSSRRIIKHAYKLVWNSVIEDSPNKTKQQEQRNQHCLVPASCDRPVLSQTCAMEMRQRKRGFSHLSIRAGEAAGRRSNDGAEEITADDRRVVEDDDVPTASDATDAVVGAAVRGGSLLMLLALIQVRSDILHREKERESI